MTQLLYPVYGTGADGVLTISSDTTDAPIDASCSGTAESTTLNANNDSFTAEDIILIHQSRGTNAGQWEINKTSSYSTGTITTAAPLTYTYVNSGADQAQVLVVKEYTSGTIASGKTLTAKAWDGDVGGILAYIFSGTLTRSGIITASGKGYRGGQSTAENTRGYQGEGTSGAGTQAQSANGNGGGGGGDHDGGIQYGAGGGGGHGAVGIQGETPPGGAGGYGGGTAGVAALTTAVFGGGGGGGCTVSGGGPAGGVGGGFVLIFANKIDGTGVISSLGNVGGSSGTNSGGGGGAGGSIFIRSSNAVLGTNLITATGGAGGAGEGTHDGGAGGTGRIRIESCAASIFTTDPASSNVIGGNSWCGSLVGFIG